MSSKTGPQKKGGPGRPPAENPLNVFLRFRVTPEFEERLNQVLKRHAMKDKTEVLREALVRYIEAEEQRLGICPEESPAQAERAKAERSEQERISEGRKASAEFKRYLG